jgi:hypothetical protein
VEFEDDPNHPYASQLLDAQDMEEYEIRDCLLPVADDDSKREGTAAASSITGSPAKKKRRRS